ncbi:unnamed protein product, partial [Discosporangium mesarthrocarpum]
MNTAEAVGIRSNLLPDLLSCLEEIFGLDCDKARVAAAIFSRLESKLDSLHAILLQVLQRPGNGGGGLGTTHTGRGVSDQGPAKLLPYIMLPLKIVLAPSPPQGGPMMTDAAKEKALLCVTAVAKWSGGGFVESCGMRDTINMLAGLVFTLTECAEEMLPALPRHRPGPVSGKGAAGQHAEDCLRNGEGGRAFEEGTVRAGADSG